MPTNSNTSPPQSPQEATSDAPQPHPPTENASTPLIKSTCALTSAEDPVKPPPEQPKDAKNEPQPPSQSTPEKKEENDEELKISDIRAAVDEIDENIDEAFGNAAQSIWNLATSVTGTVSSAVGDAPSLEQLRDNVTSHLKPLDTISHSLSSKLEGLAPPDLPESVATLAGSVKSVAQTVQKNALQMERAILSKANGNGDAYNPTSDTATATALAKNEIRTADDQAGQESSQLGSDNPSILPGHALAVEEGIAKVGETLGKTVGGLWNGLGLWGGEDSGGWERSDGQGAGVGLSGTAKVPTTRLEKRLAELQADPNTYCEPATDFDSFEKWGKTFNVDDVTEECIDVLSRHEAIAELYERVVPGIVEEDTFWMRYFFAKHVIVREEERRKLLLERAETGGAQADDDDDWGDDDWDDDNVQDNSTVSESDDKKEDMKKVEPVTGGKVSGSNKQEQITGEKGLGNNDKDGGQDVKANEEASEAQDKEGVGRKCSRGEAGVDSEQECDSEVSGKTEYESGERRGRQESEKGGESLVAQVAKKSADGEDDWGDDWE